MARVTRATVVLDRAGVVYSRHEYAYDVTAAKIGVQAAEALGVASGQLLKTLMALVDGKAVCVIVPSDCDVSMKRLAAAMQGKSASMMPPELAQRTTGYVVGGISPFGQMRAVPTLIEQSVLAFDVVYLNGGQRGLQLCLSPRDAAAVLQAIVAPLIA